jgi:hypothetical protein
MFNKTVAGICIFKRNMFFFVVNIFLLYIAVRMQTPCLSSDANAKIGSGAFGIGFADTKSMGVQASAALPSSGPIVITSVFDSTGVTSVSDKHDSDTISSANPVGSNTGMPIFFLCVYVICMNLYPYNSTTYD